MWCHIIEQLAMYIDQYRTRIQLTELQGIYFIIVNSSANTRRALGVITSQKKKKNLVFLKNNLCEVNISFFIEHFTMLEVICIRKSNLNKKVADFTIRYTTW